VHRKDTLDYARVSLRNAADAFPGLRPRPDGNLQPERLAASGRARSLGANFRL